MNPESRRIMMETPPSKAALREGLIRSSGEPPRTQASSGRGQIAERIRRMPFYREMRHLLCSPVSDLFQVRLNGLMDGKVVTVPTPGLTKGFLRLDPAAIQPARRFQAARLMADDAKAVRVPFDRPAQPPIDLVVADVLAADPEGHVLGDGSGHLDLQIAILNELGWLDPEVVLVGALAKEALLPAVPAAQTDVRVHWLMTPDEALRTSFSGFPRAAVQWDELSPRKIRRNAGLFHLYRSSRQRMA